MKRAVHGLCHTGTGDPVFISGDPAASGIVSSIFSEHIPLTPMWDFSRMSITGKSLSVL